MSIPSNVVVDIGNSKVKSALFEGDQIKTKFQTTKLQALAAHYGSRSHRWIFSTVNHSTQEIQDLFANENFLILSRETPIPIVLNYDTPETLGVDRIAAGVGAFDLFPDRNVLIIDAGTCITYDIMDKSGSFEGGVIAPGLKMRMQSMNHYTSGLPDISVDWSQIMLKNLGKSTRECLLAGSYMALTHEINAFIDHFKKEYTELVVILTGGDANFFESKVKAPIFADFDLVLRGLNRILNHNQ
ncbi:MAG: type III pantothenate kinase [Marinoscillum sp.]